jgi:hypothetical protein
MPLIIVLSVGFDPSLLRARGLVLESAGYLLLLFLNDVNLRITHQQMISRQVAE